MNDGPVTSRLLAVDVGNSRVKFGMFDLASIVDGLPRLVDSLAAAPDGPMPWQEIRGWLGESDSSVPRGIVAGSNPLVRDVVVEGWPSEWPTPRVLTDSGCLDLDVQLDHPGQAGIDRLLNAVATRQLTAAQRPAIIVDSGTATTVDMVDATGAFRGGAILPGFGLLARSLHHYTALLPLVTLEQLGVGPPPVVGQDTTTAIKSGLFFGQLGAVRELVRVMSSSVGGGPVDLFLTGGGGPLLATELTEARFVPHLGLCGLAEVARTAAQGDSP